MTQPSEDKEFLELLQQVAARPAMYVGRADLYLVTSLLWGYSWGYDHGKRGSRALILGGGTPLNGFPSWIQCKFAISHPAWGFERMLLHQQGHDHVEAIKAIPVLFEEFLQVKDEFLETDFDKDLRKAVREKYGEDQGAPDCEECGWASDL